MNKAAGQFTELLRDDDAYRKQIAYLYANSEFYRQKLTAAGYAGPGSVGGLGDISDLPFTEKDELRRSRSDQYPVGTHLAAPFNALVRIYSTSGTSGTPSFIPLTARDLADWIEISSRSYGASGVKAGEKIITTYGAGPFVAGVTLDAFAAIGLCHIPIGSGNTARLMAAVQSLKPDIIALTPSYALHIAEWVASRDIDVRSSSVRKLLVAGEPGGGEPEFRTRLEEYWSAKVTEVMGIGDISVSLWGECEQQDGMHFSGAGFVHAELIEPETGKPVPVEDEAEGELVYTHLRHQAAPLLRFRSRDHVRISAEPCACGRTSARVRCIGRTDDMLIVRGVNLFPSAVREIAGQFSPATSGVISVRPRSRGVKQTPPLPVTIELSGDNDTEPDLAEKIRTRIRDTLNVSTEITLVPAGTLPRSEYKSKLVDWPDLNEEGTGNEGTIK